MATGGYGKSKKIDGKNVLVTGGAGFLGSHLVEELLNLHANVTVVDHEPMGNIAHIKDKIKAVNGSINSSNTIKKCVKGWKNLKSNHLPYVLKNSTKKVPLSMELEFSEELLEKIAGNCSDDFWTLINASLNYLDELYLKRK